MNQNIYLSIIIPAYNEEHRIVKTLNVIDRFFENQNYSYEIIIVNDGSSDKTVEIVKNLKIKNLIIIDNKKNRGKGYAVNSGVKAAAGKYILFTDSDNSTPIEELKKILPYITQFQVIIGSRYLEESKIKIKQSFPRVFLGRMGNLAAQILLLPGISDTQCGFKLFEARAAKEIFTKQTIWRWGFDMEILKVARDLGYKIKEVPVVWRNDNRSKIQSSSVFAKTFLELIKISFNSWGGKYKQ